MLDLLQFSNKHKFFSEVKNRIKYSIYNSITKNSQNIFLRGRDLISVKPNVTYYHDPDLTSFINFCNVNGLSDFFLDIGANIGLISCQVGSHFREVYCFEPNPLCQHILNVNTEISLGDTNVHVCKFGIGRKNEILELWVPRKNWGGAFVKCEDNAYSDDIIANKDGFSEIDRSNYYIKEVEIKSGRMVLGDIFKELVSKNYTRGFIKIDVEGMEYTIIEEIAKSIPDDIEVAIEFENFNQKMDFENIKTFFSGKNIHCYKLDYFTPYKKSWPKVAKSVAMMFKDCNAYVTELSDCTDKTGDIVILVG